MTKVYPQVSIPKPLDQNRHAIVMEIAKGSLLSKTKLLNAEWYLDEILRQVKITYSLGIIHADLSEYNIFCIRRRIQLIDWPQYITPAHPQADEILERDVSNVLVHFNRKYGVKRDLEEVIGEIKSAANLSEASKEEAIIDEESRDEEGNEEASKEEAIMDEAIMEEGTGKRREGLNERISEENKDKENDSEEEAFGEERD